METLKEFNELNFGHMTMDELANKILELLRYVPYIKYERVNI